MIPVVRPDEMRAIDAAAPEPVEQLVARAGAAVAREAIRLLGGTYGRTVSVVAGPGNNGADGRVAAARLRERGVRVHLVEALDRPVELPLSDLVIDAAFGSGFRGEWSMPDVGVARVLAVDVPTGLDAATGEIAANTHPADATVTFAAARPGHVLGAGPDVVGSLSVADIGLDIGQPSIGIVEGTDVGGWTVARRRTAHKWTDAVRVVAGSPGMTGAGYLAAAGALRAGSGMVTLSSPGMDAHAPVEVVDRRIPPFDWADEVSDDLHRYHALVLGPGLGREDHTIPSMVAAITDSVVPVVVDGDGLFALSWNEAGDPSFLRDRELPTVLTPHDGEFGLLTGHRPGVDRIAAAHELVELTGATVLLKGPTTVVADPSGRTMLVTSGSERLATAGTGDVLSGMIGALLAKGVAAPEAAAAAAWVHGAASRRLGPGIVASDLLAEVPAVMEQVSST